MSHLDYIYKHRWFSWRPVRLDNGKWVWFKWVERTVDDRPLVYLGLLTEYLYNELNQGYECASEGNTGIGGKFIACGGKGL